MSAMTGFCKDAKPDAEAFLANLRRRGTPSRVHYIELFLDGETKDAICERFDLAAGISRDDPHFAERREIAIQRFLGYDYVFTALEGVDFPVWRETVPDTAEHPRAGGRSYQDEHHGPIMSWEDFEKYPWPDPHQAGDRSVAWYERNLPDDMCLLPTARGHFCEHLTWLMGYETLCYSLYEQRDLVAAISAKLLEIYRVVMARLLEYERVGVVWGSDDMGFKTATLISPDDLREFVLPGHKALAEMARAAGRPYLLHSCGNLHEIMPDLLDDVKIDGKHSFEDTIELITDAKSDYGDRCAVLGGIDVDFLCRADEQAVRRRVRETLDVCMPGGGFCLGSGNSVANYVPIDNYLAMMDEGRRYAG